MATLLEAYNLKIQNATLRNRITAACAKVAIDIVGENPATPDHAERLAWARVALADAEAMAAKIGWAVIADATILANPDGATDGQVIAAVSAAVAAYMLLVE